MESAFWDRVVAGGHRVPDDRPLADLTAELTTMLGDVDPHRRDEIAFPTLATWVSEGVYDDLLAGLGDGMTSGLTVGLGEDGTDSVFRRSFSALVLGQCVERAATVDVVPDERVLRWGDRIAGWLVRERDLRGFVPGKGWAHAVAHGADAVGELAGHRAMGHLELTVLLDVVADRLLEPTPHRFLHGEDDRLALATMRILRRDVLALDVLEPWLARLAERAAPRDQPGEQPREQPDEQPGDDHASDPFLVTGNVQGYLRALHLQLALAPDPPTCRADLLLALIDQLRRANPSFLT